MTFAIIQTGGKQYKVTTGDIINIEKLPEDYKKGDKIVFKAVLLTSKDSKTEIGSPLLKTEVEGKFIENFKDKKVKSLRFKNKTNQGSGIRRGHRQNLSKVEITKI